MSVRAKFTVSSITKFAGGSPETVQVRMYPVASSDIPEDQKFHKHTPSGLIEMTIDNPKASDQFVLSKSFYVDFTPAE